MLGHFPEYAAVLELVRAHHERWDGRGYPGGVKGEGIPIGARIISVADTFVAMSAVRPYRPALPQRIVERELIDGRGSQFEG